MRTILLICLLPIFNSLHAQVNFLTITLNEALVKANAEGKLVMLQIESTGCNQCNEVAEKGMKDLTLSAKINDIFIPLKITVSHAERQALTTTYNTGFGTLFINQKGILVHSFL